MKYQNKKWEKIGEKKQEIREKIGKVRNWKSEETEEKGKQKKKKTKWSRKWNKGKK